MSDVKLYWSRQPGNFLVKETGISLKEKFGSSPQFIGTVREWFETLIETTVDLSNALHKLAATKVNSPCLGEVVLYVPKDIYIIYECSVLYCVENIASPKSGKIGYISLREDASVSLPTMHAEFIADNGEKLTLHGELAVLELSTSFIKMNDMISVSFNKLDSRAIVPKYQTEYSAGCDLTSIMHTWIQPGEVELISTGLALEIPQGYEGQIRPRSGLAHKHRVTVLNSPGTIDSDYRGELKVMLINHGKNAFLVSAGDRIAQLVISKVEQAKFVEGDLSQTTRGSGGFGHTGI